MTNYELIKNMSIEDMAKMNVRAFHYMGDIEHRLIFIQRISTYLIQEKKQRIMSWNG